MDFSLLIKDSLHHWVIEPPAKKSNHIQCSSAFDANKTLIPMKFSSVFLCVFLFVCVCVVLGPYSVEELQHHIIALACYYEPRSVLMKSKYYKNMV